MGLVEAGSRANKTRIIRQKRGLTKQTGSNLSLAWQRIALTNPGCTTTSTIRTSKWRSGKGIARARHTN
ncbi:protein of unknown function [Burkholderia multivorans]